MSFNALGKKPRKITIHFPEEGLDRFEFCRQGSKILVEQNEHYIEALLEAANEIEKRDRRFYTFVWIKSLVKKLRITAGVE